MHELTEIMQQKDDKEFAELFSRLREGSHTSDDIQRLKERVVQNENAEANHKLNNKKTLICGK